MNNFKETSAKDFNFSPFKLIGSDWMLITAEKEGKVNTMTASWGGMGVMWAKNVAFIVIRPQRYTREFVDTANSFSLSFFEEDYKKILTYLGTVSGREEDKISKSGLNIDFEDNVPYFREAKIVMTCKKLYKQKFHADCFIEKSIIDKWYPEKDFHEIYVAEIEKILVR